MCGTEPEENMSCECSNKEEGDTYDLKCHVDQGLENELEESGRVLISHGYVKGWIVNEETNPW